MVCSLHQDQETGSINYCTNHSSIPSTYAEGESKSASENPPGKSEGRGMLRNQSGAINPLHLVTDITRVSIQFKPPWPRINNSLSLERNHIQFLPSFPRFRPPFSQIIFQIIITRNLKTWAKYLEMCPLPALGLAQLTYSYNLLLFHTFLMLTFSSHFTLAPLVLGSLGWKIQAYLYHRPRRTLLANFIHAG